MNKKSFIDFFFKIIVIEILLNNDIQLILLFKFSKGNKCNYVYY